MMVRRREIDGWRKAKWFRQVLIGTVYFALIMILVCLLFLCLIYGVKFTNQQVCCNVPSKFTFVCSFSFASFCAVLLRYALRPSFLSPSGCDLADWQSPKFCD